VFGLVCDEKNSEKLYSLEIDGPSDSLSKNSTKKKVCR
jgi:hypothetical protein